MRGVIMIQYALMCGKLSSIRRETAIVFNESTPVGPGRCASGWGCPRWPTSTAVGHAGTLVLGTFVVTKPRPA